MKGGLKVKGPKLVSMISHRHTGPNLTPDN